MFTKLTEEDFYILREPLKSGRQSPGSLGGILFLGCFLQFLMYYLIYYIAAESTVYPGVEKIQTIHLWVTVILTAFSAIFSISTVYKKFEKTQYLLSIIVSQNLFGIYLYLGALFLIGEAGNVTEGFLINFTTITLGTAVALFLAVFARFYFLLKKRKYREGSTKAERREKFETTSYIPIAIIASTGLVLIVNSLMKNDVLGGSNESVIFTILPLLIFFTMIFILPEQLVILYCKFRFKSFNFNLNGRLYSIDNTKHNTSRK
ncbi:ABC transporter ATPase [Rossellomorea vietnamensis]|uniref:ABC transporter ATPase n=1 Tax=Rossellomorea vietnamensis TaxID=218284 RepID=UPI001E3A04B9|nr:ABC transporter ATPase [Rossellomorea vietnamensis]MCC5804405.1 ABC transporter ATPase [Rossellomorea vietnamensis]